MKKYLKIFSVVFAVILLTAMFTACSKSEEKKWSDWHTITQPTCTYEGLEIRINSSAGEIETRAIAADKDAHMWHPWAVSIEVTCEEDGQEFRICRDCSKSETKVIPAHGHDYALTCHEDVSCTNNGYKEYTCSTCNDSYRENEENAWGHNHVLTHSETVSCTNDGYDEFTCSICNDSYRINEESAWGHNYVVSRIKPTCEEGGYDKHTCSACGDSYVTNERPARGHNFSVWKITKYPSWQTDGEMQRVCFRCNKTEIKIIPGIQKQTISGLEWLLKKVS